MSPLVQPAGRDDTSSQLHGADPAAPRHSSPAHSRPLSSPADAFPHGRSVTEDTTRITWTAKTAEDALLDKGLAIIEECFAELA